MYEDTGVWVLCQDGAAEADDSVGACMSNLISGFFWRLSE